jgi:hypothetical protein
MSDSSPKFKKDAKKDKMESKQQEKAARLTKQAEHSDSEVENLFEGKDSK